MVKRIEKWLLSGVIMLLISPFLIIGALLMILVASFFGVPLTAPSPPLLFRKREAAPAPAPYLGREVATAAHRLLESAPISAR